MLEKLNASFALIVTQTQNNFNFLLQILTILWFFYLLTVLSGGRLLYLGIIPRQIRGLIGIIFAPLLHAHFNHIFFNSIPMIVLSNFILIKGIFYYSIATAFITISSGVLLWLFGTPGLHVGASALITGYWGLLVSNSIKQPDLTTFILGMVCIYYFAGIFLGIFPRQKGVSWEGHLFGLIAGILFSYLY
jgi:membrane associated rhomboid family serine protease